MATGRAGRLITVAVASALAGAVALGCGNDPDQIDEDAGLIRSRVFVPELGVSEDEATGSAAILLAADLDREIEISQGRGSRLHARPVPGGRVEVGGRVELDEVRTHPG